jgi:hypothetical protein
MRRALGSTLPVLLAWSAFVACKSSEPKRTSPAPSASSPGPVALEARAGVETTASPPASPGSTDRARAALDSWLSAQNEHDFARYSALYAERFSGIKRVGKHTAWFNRKTWLDDRKGMFKPDVTVAVSDVTIKNLGRTSRAVFSQTFSANSFRDEGRKELIFVEQGDKLLISREEMLVSNVAGTSSTNGAATTERYAVRDGLIVLEAGAPAEGLRALELADDRSNQFVVTRPLDTDRLEPRLRARVGQSFDLVRPDGTLCSAKIERLAVRIEAVPHFGMVNTWRGTGDAAGGPKTPPREIALTLWDMVSPDRRYLVGVLDQRCSEAPIAFPTGTAPKIIASSAPFASTADLARAEFRRLPEYATTDVTFRAESKSKKPWDEVAARVEETAFTLSPTRELVVRSVVAGENGLASCGAFLGVLSAAFEFDTSQTPPRLVKSSVIEESQGIKQVFLFDSDRDGQHEILSAPRDLDEEVVLYELEGARVEPSSLFSIAYMDCPC